MKRNGDRHEFDHAKLAAGLEKALWRRPVPAGAAEQAADEIEAALRAQGINEVPSSRVGEMAMESLRQLDQIAYVRFASVHQSFDDIEQLKREVDELYAARSDAAPGQTSLELTGSARQGMGIPPRAPVTPAGRRSTRR